MAVKARSKEFDGAAKGHVSLEVVGEGPYLGGGGWGLGVPVVS
jgi:hypothetical protein